MAYLLKVPSWTQISSTEISGSPLELIINSDLDSYNEIKIDLVNVATSATSQWSMSWSIDGGSTFITSNCSNTNQGTSPTGVSSVAATVLLIAGVGSSTMGNSGIYGTFIFDNSSGSIIRSGRYMINSATVTTSLRSSRGEFTTNGLSNPCNYFKIVAGGVVTFSSGTYIVYGR